MGLRLPDIAVVIDRPSHRSLHPVVGTSDGMGSPGLTQEESRSGRASPEFSQRSAGPCRGGSRPDQNRVAPDAGRGVLRRLFAAIMRFDHSPAGDVAGVVLLFALLVAVLSLGGF